MANYEYLGCVTGFSEAGNTQLIQPTETLYPVTRPVNRYTERLVNVGLLLGDSDGEIISCTPTTLEFVPKVISPDGKEQIILRAVLEVNGEAVFHYNGDDGFADLSVSTSDMNYQNTPEWIANYLLLYSGIDLMRQMNVRNYFDYSPNGELVEGQPISLWGLEETVPDGMLSLPRIPADVKLTFKVIDNLPSNAVDFTLEQWGRDVSVFGCAVYDLSQTPM